MTLEEMFTGPLGHTSRPLLDESEYDAHTIFIADISSRVRAVDGVAEVRNLHLVRRGDGTTASEHSGRGEDLRRFRDLLPRFARGGRGDPPVWTAPRLAVPGSATGPGPGLPDERVRLWRDGRRVAEPPDFPARYRAARHGYRLGERRRGTTEAFYKTPVGEHRALGTYQSIQQHFPAIYGINAHGVPGSAPEGVWLSAFRLKSYLLLFEQFMADFAANLHHLRDLYSSGQYGAGGGAALTYRFLALGDKQIPGFEGFYGDVGDGKGGGDTSEGGGFGPYLSNPDAHLKWVVALHDDVLDRRSRLQDHMLSVFGESLAGDDDGEQHEVSDRLVKSRARLLEQIPAVTRDRGGAVDLLAPDAETASGFKRRIALLLGLRADAGFHVLEHVLLRPVGGRLSDDAWAGFYGLQVSVFFPHWVSPRGEEVVLLNCPAHVRAQCFRLTADQMAEFELLEEDWRNKKSLWLQGRSAAWTGGEPGDAGAVDHAAAELVRFVWAMRRAYGV
jgi:hypothetical protein